MQMKCRAKDCTSSAEVPERPSAVRADAFKRSGFTRLMTVDETITVCAPCLARLGKLALQLAELLNGHEVPLWQLIPAAKRGILKGEDLRRGPRT